MSYIPIKANIPPAIERWMQRNPYAVRQYQNTAVDLLNLIPGYGRYKKYLNTGYRIYKRHNPVRRKRQRRRSSRKGSSNFKSGSIRYSASPRYGVKRSKRQKRSRRAAFKKKKNKLFN